MLFGGWGMCGCMFNYYYCMRDKGRKVFRKLVHEMEKTNSESQTFLYTKFDYFKSSLKI